MDDLQRPSSPWPFPFADAASGRLSRRHWRWIVAGFVALHLAALLAAQRIEAFTPDPNADHVRYMRQILEQGYPAPGLWPPGFAYYLAFKWQVTAALGLPYWSGKYFLDVFPVIAAGVLSILLGQALTKNRFLALASGLGLVGAPIFILLVAMEGAAIFFQPFFLFGLLVVVRETQRAEGPRISRFALAGAVIGLSCLIRGNPQYVVAMLAPFVVFTTRGTRAPRPGLRAAAALAAFVVAQNLAMLPWSLWQRQDAKDGLMPFSGVYRAYYYGLTRHAGNPMSDWIREHYDEPERSLSGAVDVNLTWLERDPAAWLELYALKFARAWYTSDSGRWNTPILLVHLPLWILALAGVWSWHRTARGDPAYLFTLLFVAYMWGVAAIVDGIARHFASVYGAVGLLAGVGLTRRLRSRLPAG